MQSLGCDVAALNTVQFSASLSLSLSLSLPPSSSFGRKFPVIVLTPPAR